MPHHADTIASRTRLTPVRALSALSLLFLAVVPLLSFHLGHEFWIDLFTRLVILCLAALSLNLLLGFGGLPSFGHAAYLGIGAYCVGIPVHHAIYGGGDWLASESGWFHFGLAIACSAVFALLTGIVSLRTRGVHFIMITMAFSQMIYYTLVSLEAYGADDGLTIIMRSQFGFVDLDDPRQLYVVCFVALLVYLVLIHRIVHSRFGRILDAIRQNEERTRALGINAFLYRLVAFVIAGSLCGFAGALQANYSTFISPSIVEWSRSGELMFMVILGGTAYLFGPLFGAIVFVLLEFYLSQWTIYWHLPFGLLLILTVLVFRGGIGGLLNRTSDSIPVADAENPVTTRE